LDRGRPGGRCPARDERIRYPVDGPNARRGEDSVLLDSLLAHGVEVASLEGAGDLWLYTYHGRNTFPAEHHYRLASFGVPRAFLAEREPHIRAALEHYPIPRPALVSGRDGPAFVVA
jgi:hypothetical protein